MAIRRPPGPRTLRPSGMLPELRRDMLGFFTRLAREWGDVVGYRVYHVPVVFLNDPALIREVLGPRDDAMLKPWDLRQLRLVLGDGLLTGSGEVWRRHRRLAAPSFHHERLVRYADGMGERAHAAAERWPEGEAIDVHAALSRLTLEIVTATLFGADLPGTASHGGVVGGEAVGRIMTDVMDAFERSIAGPLLLPFRVPTPAHLRIRRGKRRLDAIVEEIVRARRSAGGGGDDLLGALLEAAEASDPDGRGAAPGDPGSAGLTEDELRDELLTLLLAGHETTALALTWTLYLLGGSPDEEARLVEEVDRELGGRPPRAEDLKRLPRTTRAVTEALRLYPPAWGVGREAARDLELGAGACGRAPSSS